MSLLLVQLPLVLGQLLVRRLTTTTDITLKRDFILALVRE